MCKARDLNQSPTRLRSAVAYVSNAINSVKRKEALSCSAVILCKEFNAAFDSRKIQTVLREGTRVCRLSLLRGLSLPLVLPREGHVSEWVSQRERDPAAHRGIEPHAKDFALWDQQWFCFCRQSKRSCGFKRRGR